MVKNGFVKQQIESSHSTKMTFRYERGAWVMETEFEQFPKELVSEMKTIKFIDQFLIDIPSFVPDTTETLIMKNCKYLKHIAKLPSGLKKFVCTDMRDLESIGEFPDGLQQIVLSNNEKLTEIPEIPKSVVSFNYYNTPLVTTTVIPEGVDTITVSPSQQENLPKLPKSLYTILIDKSDTEYDYEIVTQVKIQKIREQQNKKD